MKKLTLFFVSALAALSVAAVNIQLAPVAFAADPKDEICAGIGVADQNHSCGDASQLSGVIRNFLNIFSVVIGITAVIMIMVAGFKYITAAGDSGNITSAKHTLIYAIIGLIVVAFSQIIVQFVLDTVS
jgi:hypothetical protein